MPNRVGGCYEFRRNSGFLQETSFRFGLKNRRNWPLSAGIYRNFESERNFLIFRGSNSFRRNRNKHPRYARYYTDKGGSNGGGHAVSRQLRMNVSNGWRIGRLFPIILQCAGLGRCFQSHQPMLHCWENPILIGTLAT